MTRALDLPQKQIVALCKAAKKAGYVPEIRVGKTFIRLVPEDRAVRPQDDGLIDEERVIDL